MPAGFRWLLAAQFASALADNALLIVTMALLEFEGLAAWWAPLLKFGFTIAYVVFAPAVGDLADAIPKARLMAWMNMLKLAGAASLLFAVHPVLSFAVVGVGAAAYAPAKYGLMTEILPPSRLVAANGWIEVSVVSAALLGTALGGGLVSSSWLQSEPVAWGLGQLSRLGLQVQTPLAVSLMSLLLLYAAASVFNFFVPDSGARYPRASVHPIQLVQAFKKANLTLWRDHEGGLSLAVTTLFWGLGATLQFIVLRWAQDCLGLALSRAASLQVAVALGVVLGAWLAGRFIPLNQARRMLPAGICLCLMMPLVSGVSQLHTALILLSLAGALGGLMVVPLNALLQHRGCVLLSAGRSIAVQGFNENASILVMLAIYAALLAMDVSIVALMWGFGLVCAALLAWIMWRLRRPVTTS